MQEDLERAKELLRQAYAILTKFDAPNIRQAENLALLAATPKPSPLPPVGPPIVVVPAPAEEVE